jgi:hypothetical protein
LWFLVVTQHKKLLIIVVVGKVAGNVICLLRKSAYCTEGKILPGICYFYGQILFSFLFGFATLIILAFLNLVVQVD